MLEQFQVAGIVAFTDDAKNLAIDYATAKFNQRVLTAKEKALIVGNEVEFEAVGGVVKQQEVVRIQRRKME